MKFSAATAVVLGMVPLALGKAIHNAYPVRRNGHNVQVVDAASKDSVPASEAQLEELAQLIGLHRGSGQAINFLWVNLGGGAATTVIGSASTVTVTKTVAADATATAPPAVITDVAGSTTVAAPPSTTVVAGGATHTVTVGGPAGLVFTPQELNAAVGDTVIFTFLSQNHTATQSSFDKPCEALAGGMDSGFQANANNTVNPPPQVAMQVMVDTPLWFYCRQKGHCGKGMVFSINPTAEKTHAQFQANAIQQAGNGAGGAITGNPPPADPNAGTGGAAESSASASVTAPPAPTATDAAGSIQTGTGTVAPDGSCVCAVQCSFGGFPNQAVQGRDSFGGFGGALPMAMVPAAARRV
ncbi:hypothetical protein MYCTH_2312604 [Thermothelomyces thermophilus ATCC 42464]|uniref:Phytocyanin domain-containing protein n=1 Tax=Thermothelomyces thermophilus (strain ATCC 42464 / BCRC 31852 / DSM 1799) TaxID=573729 RepID=G2QN10_THET4|nr:uncharacterized protein MYCTH_2312604 [Thermothelomyces thermophilus ATCC 42464]AEO61883.1 hypothetical protein MYCTH_2312604 [Thermothelomyces thermophilus ATCC 42464]